MRLEGDSLSAKYIHPVLHTWRGPAEQLVRAAPPAFQYVVYGGRYQLLISLCHTGAGSGGREECQQEIETGYVSVQSELFPECQQNNERQNFGGKIQMTNFPPFPPTAQQTSRRWCRDPAQHFSLHIGRAAGHRPMTRPTCRCMKWQVAAARQAV